MKRNRLRSLSLLLVPCFFYFSNQCVQYYFSVNETASENGNSRPTSMTSWKNQRRLCIVVVWPSRPHIFWIFYKNCVNWREQRIRFCYIWKDTRVKCTILYYKCQVMIYKGISVRCNLDIIFPTVTCHAVVIFGNKNHLQICTRTTMSFKIK